MTSKLEEIAASLASTSQTPRLDARLLLAHVLQAAPAWVLAHPEAPLTPAQLARLHELLVRLQSGEPLPYLLGSWEFYGLRFQVTPAVLIPRPETELLVEVALHWLHAHPHCRQAADIGTGSGCIAISLASHIPDLRCIAIDRSPAALQVAAQNALTHTVHDRIRFVEADLFPSSDWPPCDLICANLPYIPTATLHGLPVFGREPTLALDGGPDGLDLIRRLLAGAPARLAPSGLLLAEIEARQGPQALELARRSFPTAAIEIRPDLAGLDRLLVVSS